MTTCGVITKTASSPTSPLPSAEDRRRGARRRISYSYHTVPSACCGRRMPGDTDGTGVAMLRCEPGRDAGWTMGMGLRARVAAGWWSFIVCCCACWSAGRLNEGEEALREKAGAAWVGCDGECSGELLASDERSDALWMDTSFRGGLVRESKGSGGTTADREHSRRSQSEGPGRTRDRPPGQTNGQPRTSCERQSGSGCRSSP